MTQVTLSLPDQTGLALKLSPESLPGELLLAAAMKLYELGRLSAGAAAELAGVPKPVFLSKLADYGVAAFRQDAAELREEWENA
jgi:predicted HTH domain antitoxin